MAGATKEFLDRLVQDVADEVERRLQATIRREVDAALSSVTATIRLQLPSAGTAEGETEGEAPAATSAGDVLPEPDPSDDEFLATVAAAYREIAEAGGAPTKALVERYGKSRSTVSGWIRRCRDAGLLPPSSQGRVTA